MNIECKYDPAFETKYCDEMIAASAEQLALDLEELAITGLKKELLIGTQVVKRLV